MSQNNNKFLITELNQEKVIYNKFIATNLLNSTSYYKIFSDIWLMSHGQCISYGQGGYGRFGYLLQQQQSSSCYMNYFQQSQFILC